MPGIHLMQSFKGIISIEFKFYFIFHTGLNDILSTRFVQLDHSVANLHVCLLQRESCLQYVHDIPEHVRCGLFRRETKFKICLSET